MGIELLLVVGVAIFIAYANGANDVSKGIATLTGSGVTSAGRAILWGGVWTAAGGLLACVVAGAMLSTFGGGLLHQEGGSTAAVALASIFGAGAWVLFSTRFGLPVSTTHALAGGIVGVGIAAYGLDGVVWGVLGKKVFLPLFLTPFVAISLAAILARLWRVKKDSKEKACICVTSTAGAAMSPNGSGAAVGTAMMIAAPPAVTVQTGTEASCAVHGRQTVRLTLDHLHWLSSGATSFARGMNDVPKIVALMLVAAALTDGAALTGVLPFAIVTGAMFAGALIAGMRVTKVMANDITEMNHREGFQANVITAGLVSAGAVFGLPMSTTHVSASAIMGTATQRGKGALKGKKVREMLLAWVITLPAAALLGAGSYALFSLWG